MENPINRFLFRAWDFRTHSMFYPIMYPYDEPDWLKEKAFAADLQDDRGHRANISDIFTNRLYVPMQWTGKKDKRGAFIYEWDILDFESKSFPRYGWVVWSEKTMMFVVVAGNERNAILNLSYTGRLMDGDCEVVGTPYSTTILWDSIQIKETN